MPEYLTMATKIENQNEIMNNDIVVSPNPTNGIFSVNMQTESLRDIYVYDVNGKIVFESKGALEKSLNVDLSNQAEGIYFIRIMDAKTSVIKKVIKQ
ncbi:MAG: T9SS type A sorting domain-containing protein [Sphingobacteriaceae bacterium]|nr:T9SS type A sorting domain-containing protein [Sphingobacteriaceae bacterium]